MGTHIWLFPWVSLIAGAISVGVGLFASRAIWRNDERRLPRLPYVIVWVVSATIAILLGVRFGHIAGDGYGAARGLLLGSLAGLAISWAITRLRAIHPWSPAVHFGLATAMIALGRLWLTHSEVTGLSALALGIALALLCLVIAPSYIAADDSDSGDSARRAALSLAYIVTLSAAVILGFSRADALNQMYWADIPLLISATLSLAALASASASKAGTAYRAATIVPPIIVIVLAAILARQAERSWILLGIVATGAVLAAVLAAIVRRDETVATEPAMLTASLTSVASATLILIATILAFTLWSGYGLALLALGAWTAIGWPTYARPSAGSSGLLNPMAFLAALLVYRLAMLQDAHAFREFGPGDIWDLFAIALGVMVPALLAQWSRVEALASRLPGWAILVQWIVGFVAPIIILEYVWEPRSLAGLFLGVAIGQLLAGRAFELPGLAADMGRTASTVVTSLVTALTLFFFLPLMDQEVAPTRAHRVEMIAFLTVLLLIRLAIPYRRAPRADGAFVAAQEGA